MNRLLWTAVGAAGGIFLYRRGSRVVEDARERGIVLAAQDVAASAASTMASARALITPSPRANGGSR